MKIAFTTLGCKLNFAESSALSKALIEHGHTRIKQGEQADICIINTCSVTDAADHKDRQAIHRIRRQHPTAIIIVTGCYAQLQPEQIALMPEVDYVLGMNEKFSIPALVEELEARANTAHHTQPADIQCSAIRQVDTFHHAYSKDDRTRCFLKVQDGCNYFCTYCTIPLARGKSRNPKVNSLVLQAEQAIIQGAKEIVLTGVNIGDFGRSTNETFIELLQALDQINTEKEYRIRISSCEPNLLTDEIIDFVASSKHFAPHFHIPLQSGSNAVLRIMQRRYTRELFAERVEHIRQVLPNAFIGVDCMVGVRGETDTHWQDYLCFIQSLPVSQLHVFTYSERANTRMLDMDLYVVPKKEREQRSKILHQVSLHKLTNFYASQAGQTARVLWESKRIRNNTPTVYPQSDNNTHYNSEYLMEGFTENYIRLACPYNKNKINTYETLIIPNDITPIP